jgi:hypothetical protein
VKTDTPEGTAKPGETAAAGDKKNVPGETKSAVSNEKKNAPAELKPAVPKTVTTAPVAGIESKPVKQALTAPANKPPETNKETPRP